MVGALQAQEEAVGALVALGVLQQRGLRDMWTEVTPARWQQHHNANGAPRPCSMMPRVTLCQLPGRMTTCATIGMTGPSTRCQRLLLTRGLLRSAIHRGSCFLLFPRMS